MQVNDSCEATDKHTFVWVAAENGQQLWKCSQCLKTKIEWEDSQP